MTSFEHVSVEPVPHRSPCWIGDGEGGADAAEPWGDVQVEEVGVGIAVTTPDDDDTHAYAHAHTQAQAHIQAQAQCEQVQESDEVVVGDTHNDSTRGVGSYDGGASVARSGSMCVSRSASCSNSRSRSMTSVREVGASSATSWTQVEEMGERPSGESVRGEGRCGSSADQPRVPRLTLTEGIGGEGGRDVSRKEEVLVLQEEDIGEGWHPLRKTRSQGDDGEEETKRPKGVEEDVGSVRVLDSDDHFNEKTRWRTFGSSGRNTRHLHLEFRRPSPQPWDDIDPPASNNEMYGSDYYSTLNSKTFGTLQKSRRRPQIPHSSYYFGPPPSGSAYGTPPVGQIGVHHPREIVRIERDYGGGELIQFSPIFPLELEGRITPTQFLQTINDINEILISAHNIQRSFLDNFLAVVTLQLSTLILTSHYTKEMRRLKRKIEEQNTQLYNPVGLNILWPRKVAFLFLEIEYY